MTKNQQLRIIASSEEPQHELSTVISEHLQDGLNLTPILLPSNNSQSSIDSILAEKADITIVENFVPYSAGIRTIMPLYEQVLHIFHNKNIKATTFNELFEGKTVYLGEKGSSTRMLMEKLFVVFEVDVEKVKITEKVFDLVDVFCAFTHIIRKEDLLGMEDYRLFSFDNLNYVGKGSIVEGLCLKNPYLSPFVIPNQLYNQINPEPVVTLSSLGVLVGRENLPKELVYDIIQILRASKMKMSRGGVVSQVDFNDTYNLSRINFPVHQGTLDYLDRHQPSFLERYAEVISVVISLIIALGSAIITINSWTRQRKKNRVDQFYAEILDIKAAADNSSSTGDLQNLINRIQLAQNKAFQMLMDEKLIADESFRIFIELSKDALADLEKRQVSMLG